MGRGGGGHLHIDNVIPRDFIATLSLPIPFVARSAPYGSMTNHYHACIGLYFTECVYTTSCFILAYCFLLSFVFCLNVLYVVCLGCLIGGVINDDRPEVVETARNQVQSRARLKRTQKPEG